MLSISLRFQAQQAPDFGGGGGRQKHFEGLSAELGQERAMVAALFRIICFYDLTLDAVIFQYLHLWFLDTDAESADSR